MEKRLLLDEQTSWLNNYTTRLLNENDLEAYLNLLGETKTFMGRPYNKDRDKEYATAMFFDPKNKISGTFDSSNKLVTVISGYFFPNFPHWYVYRVFQQVPERSLLGGVRNYMLLVKTLFLLINYAEENHYYSYYNIFTLDHQLSWEKGFKILTDKNMFVQTYTYHWEDIYLPGEGCKHRNHQFFFEMDRLVDVPCVVTLCVLNQSVRRKYFSERYNLTDTKNYLPTPE